MDNYNAFDILDEEHQRAENKSELDMWAPLGKLIFESIESRDKLGISQTQLAELMKTRQSVISRFENMGRTPNYDFIARMSVALGHIPGVTLYGDYMAVVPLEKQQLIKERATQEGVTTQYWVSQFFDKALEQAFVSIESVCGDTIPPPHENQSLGTTLNTGIQQQEFGNQPKDSLFDSPPPLSQAAA
jgi:transcriptional regulator with XRE-family HTH domain